MELSEDKVKRVQEVLGSYWAINRITAKHAEQNALSLGLSLQQMAIINILYTRPDSTIDDLKKKLFTSTEVITANVNGLVHGRLVEKLNTAFVENADAWRLQLTDKGREMSERSTQNAFAYKAMMKALEELDDKEIDKLIEINHKIEKLLKTD
ncbi:MarR family winged helix-turn-helix transcriptional regulator [Listeria booriae]|uniref:MarR family winged helix-turn-helix transcriptional regulator n=1 Tax=Listeria booriae TaxID=1552123 RepID=UPI001626838A|nr:MarR family winged helix-turn-helix transcriptional regulator [Listeria booriae]MBC1976036.1 winged helix-turn-helix transcriptional regulator [Listeria booriae]MBC1985015.1 winged helix-turn-helix transcriptional regulator [Listeria booriae]MBC2020099.1 winged helix-turn-helix transcriptional regulator [Listeria booriae]MBC2033598.1 winged helix-turn-helix transcriptional regulator [Listeria booriae]MBC2047118.1 winged helix-turn-helix transcriptional regulator [Listeria booriae]